MEIGGSIKDSKFGMKSIIKDMENSIMGNKNMNNIHFENKRPSQEGVQHIRMYKASNLGLIDYQNA
jgi:hypothetical protein